MRSGLRPISPIFAWRWASADLAALLFCAGLFAFGALRARNEYRWSLWAYGDAQMLNAAIHFRDEGFSAHHFLPQMNPGFSHDLIGNNAPNGRYTHYPALHALVAGVLAKLWGDPRVPAKLAAVGAFSLALLLWYLFLRAFFGRPVALLTCVLMGLSPLWLDLMDALCGQPYDELFRAAVLLLGAWLFFEKPSGPKRAGGLLALWLTLFLQAFNSVELIASLQIYLLGLILASGLAWKSKARLAAFLALAPALSFALHFAQTAAEWGSVSGAIADWKKPFAAFVLGSDPLWRQAIDFGRAVWLPWAREFCRLSLWLAAVGGGLLLARSGALFLLLCASSFSFYILLPTQALRMAAYAPVHGLPVLALCVSAALAEGLRAAEAARLRPAVSRLSLAALLAAVLPASCLARYFRDYPNPLWTSGDRWVAAEGSENEWRLRVQRAEWIKRTTAPGDWVFVPEDAKGNEELEADPIQEYFSQRHLLPLGYEKIVFERRLTAVMDGVRRFQASIPDLSPERVCFLADPARVPGTLDSYLKANFREESKAAPPLPPYRLYRFGGDASPTSLASKT